MLDDGPFGELARVVRATAHWEHAVLNVTEAVADAAKSDKSGRRQWLLDERCPTGKVVTDHKVLPGTNAWNMLFTHLRARYADATADFGEHEAIALCACELPSFVFVTVDKTAALLALAELGRSRVATPFDVWEDLRTRGFIDASERDLLHERTLRGDTKIPGVPWRLREGT